MTRQEVLAVLKEHLPELKARYGVGRLALFGSVARDEARADSDLDILVDFGRAPDFDQYMGTKFYLEDLFGRSVDLATEGTLKPRVVPYVEKDLLEVSDAT